MQPADQVQLFNPETDPRPRGLAWAAAMCAKVGDLRAAEGCLLELLAWCAFTGPREHGRN